PDRHVFPPATGHDRESSRNGLGRWVSCRLRSLRGAASGATTMGNDELEGLLDFRWTSGIGRDQPDPYALKQIVDALQGFRHLASGAQLPDDLIRLIEQWFVDGFRRLDALPREDPFWLKTNRRPTLGKVKEYADYVLRDD